MDIRDASPTIRDASPTDRDAMAAVSAAAGVAYSPGSSWGWPEADSGLVVGLPQADAGRGIISGMIESSNTLLRWLYELEEQEPTHEPFVSSKLAKALKETNGWDENTTLGLIAGLNSNELLKGAKRRSVKDGNGTTVEALEVLHFDGLSEKGRQKAQSLPGSGLG